MAKKLLQRQDDMQRLRQEFGALSIRVQRLEQLIQASKPRLAKTERFQAGQASPSNTEAARREAIREYDRRETLEILKKNPDVLHRLQVRRDRLNQFLRQRGLDPEPDIEA